MLKFLLRKLRDFLADTPLKRTILIVLSVFYIIKQSYISSQQPKETPDSEKYKPTEEQIEYKNSQTTNSLIFSGVLLVIYISLRVINSRNQGVQDKGELKVEEVEEEESEGELWKNEEEEKEEGVIERLGK